MPEKIDTIVSLLKTNWVKANTNSRIPFIDKIWLVRDPDVRDNNDFVLFSQIGNNPEYPALAMDWKDEDWLLSMDIRTGTRDQIILIDDEIMRILEANITDVSNNSYFEPRGRRDLVQDENKPYYRSVRDVKIVDLSIGI